MKRVLIVGKSESATAQLKRILTSLDYDVTGVATTGAAALLKVERLTPDIVLIDAAIPGEIDGIDAARLIQEGLCTPVLLLVDHADEQSISRVKQAKLNKYIVKPVKEEELKAGIEDALKKWETKRDIPTLYEELVENTYDLIHVQDGAGYITFINNAVTETLGYSYKEIVGKKVKDIVTPKTFQLLREIFKRRLAGEGANPFEMQVYDKQGNVKTLETRERLIWEGKRVVEIQGISRDITERKRIENNLVLLNRLKEQLLVPHGPSEKFELITDKIVEVFGADFARIWMVGPGDLCDKGCHHAGTRKGPHACRDRSRCLHLTASSGRYTHTDGTMHRRVPFGAYKIGTVASGQNAKFLTNDASHDPQVHNHAWAKELGLVSFAGYRLLSREGEPIGVLGLFSTKPISAQEDSLLEDLANTAAQVIQSSRTEETLRESEERYRAFFENAVFGIFNTLPDGKPLRVNRAYATVLGYDSPEEVLATVTDVGRDIYAEPADRPRVITEIMRKADWGVFEERLRRKDGAIIDARIHSRPVYEPDNTLAFIEGFIEDITEKKRAEEAMQRDRELKEKILQTATVGIAFAENRKITWANAAMEQTFGFSGAAEYVGKDTSILYASEEEYQRIGKLAYEGIKSGEIVEAVAEFKRADSTEFLGLVRVSFVYPDEPLREIVVSISDITEKVKAEEALRESEQRYRLLAEHANDIIFTTDADLRFTYISPSVERIRGFTVEEAMAQTPAEALAPDSLERGMKVLTESLAAEADGSGSRVETKRIDLEETCKDGSTIWTETTFTVLRGADGVFTGLLGITRDITERKKAEEELRLNEKRLETLLELNRMTGASESELTHFTMEAAVRLTGSSIGYIAFASEDETVLTMYAWSQQAMRECAIEEKPIVYRVCETGLWGEAIRQRRAVITNDYAAPNPLKKGVPDGHVQVTRHMNVPVFDGDRIVVVAGVGNKPEDYGDDDLRQLTLLMSGMWAILRRKRFETALAESEEKYRMVVENAYEGIAVIQENVFVFANRRLLDIFGYTDQEFLGRNYNDFLVPDDRSEADAEYYRKIAGDGYSSLSLLRIITKAGDIRWTEVSGIQIPWEGEPALIIFVRDVTERKAIEQALIQSEAKYRDLIENAIDLIFTVDTKGNFLEVNESLLRDTGYSKQDIVSTGFRIFVHPEDAGIALDAYEKGRQGMPHEFEMRGKKKDGTYGWYSFVIRPIFGINGTVEYVHCIARNITDRKTAEEALVDSERKFRGVFEMSRDFMFISSLAGEILDYNPQAKDFFGYTDEEVRRTNIIDIYANPDERDAVLTKLMEEGFVENYEISLEKKDGSIVEALVTATVRRDRQGGITGFQGSARDITKMKRMERQLLQAEKLSGLGTMISGVAHEINNPLTAIMGNAELMLMNESVTLNDRKSLEVILHESERAAKIVGGLLTFAREHTPERRMISVNDVIMEAQRLREYSLRVSNIRTELFLSDDLPLTFADPYQLQQVFSNIINNARDALMDVGGGTLTIRTIRRNGEMLIEFEDDGPGVANENIQKIFDPFYTTKDIGKGTGLGLSIAYGIVEEHNGKIEIESRQGMGAKFTVELPIVDRAERATARTPEEPKVIRGGKSILIVDDERDVLEFLSRALTQCGYIIQTASTAEEALALMNTQVFDAVVADIKMPGMGGREMYAYVRENMPGAAEKMLFITGDILGDETQAFIADTGNMCIKKPFKLGEFVTRLNELIIP